MTNHPNRSMASGPDLAVIITRQMPNDHRIFVSIIPATEQDEANPHMTTPTEYGFMVQAGPVYNNVITTIGRAANRRDANKLLRREEARLGLPSGVLKPRDDGPQF